MEGNAGVEAIARGHTCASERMSVLSKSAYTEAEGWWIVQRMAMCASAAVRLRKRMIRAACKTRGREYLKEG